MIIKVNYTVSDIYIGTTVSAVYIKVVYSGVSAGGGTWGTITGTLSAQTDLQTALDAKFDDPTGTTAQYLRGDGTLATFPTIPSITGLVPYTGATGAVNLGAFSLTANSIIKSSGISSQFLKADGSVDSSTYTPTTRTLTINGTTFDLSADRSWTIAAGVTGSGVSGQLTYWNGTGSVTGSAGLVYNDSTGAMTLSKNQNADTFFLVRNTNNNAAARAYLSIESNGSNGQFSLIKNSITTTPYKLIASGDAAIFNSQVGDIAIANDTVGGKIKFAGGGASTAQMTLTAAGRLLLGTTSESTFLLDVNGTARVNGVVENQLGLAISGNPTFRVANQTFLLQSVFASQSYIQSFNTSTTALQVLNILGDPIRFGNTNGTVLSIENSGSLNMRTTLSAWASNLRVIQMQGGASFASYTVSPSAQVYTNLYFNGTDYKRISSGNGSRYSQYLGEHLFEITGAGAADSNATLTNALQIFNTGNVSINNGTDIASAILHASSTTKGFLPPRMTTTQRDAIATPATGLQVYNTTTNENNTYNGTAWVGGSANIYTTDGTLTSARALTSGGFPLTFTGSNTAASAIARGLNLTHTLVAAANSDVLVGLDVQPTFTVGSFTNVKVLAARFAGNISFGGWTLQPNGLDFGYDILTGIYLRNTSSSVGLKAGAGVDGTNRVIVNPDGSTWILGTTVIGGFTNAGYRLDVNGTARVSGKLSVNTPTAISAVMEITSTTQGFLPPRMTTTQINAIATPAEGLMAYNTTISHMCVYQAGAWVKINHSPM